MFYFRPIPQNAGFGIMYCYSAAVKPCGWEVALYRRADAYRSKRHGILLEVK